ncbi:hypothetical protein B0H17DRAFT_1109232 [Mycena rosella]|uniref:Uncharacterized protein n=1 Tax=Mycena rosella TaxID=1033263 RepID=A0AAD7BSV7_MYCRO|nr:hypothetical protein B0H17DRAFT_1109232 [Mycena rosella]
MECLVVQTPKTADEARAVAVLDLHQGKSGIPGRGVPQLPVHGCDTTHCCRRAKTKSAVDSPIPIDKMPPMAGSKSSSKPYSQSSGSRKGATALAIVSRASALRMVLSRSLIQDVDATGQVWSAKRKGSEKSVACRILNRLTAFWSGLGERRPASRTQSRSMQWGWTELSRTQSG